MRVQSRKEHFGRGGPVDHLYYTGDGEGRLHNDGRTSDLLHTVVSGFGSAMRRGIQRQSVVFL